MSKILEFCKSEWARLAGKISLPDAYTLAFDIEKEPLLDDAYHIMASAEGVMIQASNERSALQGIYRFFYNLGVRYLEPGADREWIPDSWDPALLVQDVMVRPQLRHRGVCIEGADSLENIVDFIDWMPKIGMNSFFVQFRYPYTFMQHWYEHFSNPMLPAQKYTMEQCVQDSGVIDEAMALRGILHHRVGHGWTSAVLNMDAQGWDVQEGVITEEQKALMAEIGGKRDLYHGVPLNTNLCYSSPVVMERFTDEVVRYAKEHPEVQYLHLWLADANNNHCECEECRKRIPTDNYVRLINHLDKRLTEEGMDTKIVFLIYEELLWAPEQETIANLDRFVLMFAPISRSFEKSYQDVTEIPEPAAYELNHIKVPVRVEENLSYLKAWQKHYQGDSFDYDYHLGRAHYGDFGYVHISEIISKDMKQLPELGLNGLISCQELRVAFPNALPNYIMGMTGTDLTLSYTELTVDYYRHMYGEMGDSVLEYMSTISSLCSCDYFNGKGSRLRPDMVERYEKALAVVREYRPQILKAVGCPEKSAQRLLYHSYYCEYLLKALILKASGQEEALVTAAHEFFTLIQTHEWQYQSEFDVYRITEIMRNYTKISL